MRVRIEVGDNNDRIAVYDTHGNYICRLDKSDYENGLLKTFLEDVFNNAAWK